jgi:3-hydroxy-3-methylglutaryl CoA synthase
MAVGLHAFGTYLPKTRLQREAMASAYTWFNPALRNLSQGERSVANWDEDAVTMAVEAARNALGTQPRQVINSVYLASTSLPFQDRQNAGIVGEALNIGADTQTVDITGSQRAGTSALITALQIAENSAHKLLVVAGEKRQTKAGSPLELTSGDAGAAFLVDNGEGIARLLAHATKSVDFVDHYRGQNQPFDYVWEERWVRDEGHLEIVPSAVNKALDLAELRPKEINHFCFPAPAARVASLLAKRLGLPADSIRANLQGSCGEAGAAHPLLMLAHALEDAKAGDIILVVGFGQGCDALLFQVTDNSAISRPSTTLNEFLRYGRSDTNYHRYLAINNLVTIEQGLRAEVDKQTGLTTLYRNREMLLGLIGGRCTTCATLQYPKTNICANPDCGESNTQTDHPFSDMAAKLKTYTADRLTYSPDPPAYYGMVEFEKGGRAMMDFTDIEPNSELQVGQSVRLMFRVKDYDTIRGFRRYFWKAAPVNVGTDRLGEQ